MISQLIDQSLICLNLKADTKVEVFDELSTLLKKGGRIHSKTQFLTDVLEREELGNTGFERGIAIPHAKSSTVRVPTIAIGVSKKGISDYGSEDGQPAKFFFMIATPEDNADLHIEILAQLSSKLIQPDFIEKLQKANSPNDVMSMMIESNEKKEIELIPNNESLSVKGLIIGVTGCPTGIAHTYLAAEALESAAKSMGYEIIVETNGSIGVRNSPSADDIERADAIIVACDKQVDLERFNGKRMIQTGVKAPIRDAKGLINRALNGTVYYSNSEIKHGGQKSSDQSFNKSAAQNNSLYRYLMNGVSHMIPFVVTGGLLIALALAIGGQPLENGMVIPKDSLWNKVLDVGVVAFTLMVPVLAGYIAYAIGDRAALAPGLIGGWIANNGSFYGAEAGTGFIGAIIAGLLVGYFVKYLVQIKFHKYIQPLVPIMIAPITASLFIAFVFIFIIGAPIALLMDNLNALLTSMSGGNLILLGIVLGGMAGFDMGGPFNKVAFLFSVGMIANGQTQFMGAMACAIPVAPLGMFIATILGRKLNLFEQSEFEAGKAAGAMGLVGISEGAIPFAAQDPFSVIPANVIGSMVAAVMAFLFGVTNSVAHGGPVVALLGAMNKPVIALLCMVIGAIVTAFVCIALKQIRRKNKTELSMA